LYTGEGTLSTQPVIPEGGSNFVTLYFTLDLLLIFLQILCIIRFNLLPLMQLVMSYRNCEM